MAVTFARRVHDDLDPAGSRLADEAPLLLALTMYDDEIAQLSAEVERLRAEIRDLHQSTSWKVTAPMRGIKNAGLRLRSALHRTINALLRRDGSAASSLRSRGADRSITGVLWLQLAAPEALP